MPRFSLCEMKISKIDSICLSRRRPCLQSRFKSQSERRYRVLSENEFNRPVRHSVKGGKRGDRLASGKSLVDSIKKFMTQISPTIETSSL